MLRIEKLTKLQVIKNRADMYEQLQINTHIIPPHEMKGGKNHGNRSSPKLEMDLDFSTGTGIDHSITRD